MKSLFFTLSLWAAFVAYASAAPGRMKLLSKEVFLRYDGRRPPATGFITYVSKNEPVLMHCHGWEDYSDGYDDYTVSLSRDIPFGLGWVIGPFVTSVPKESLLFTLDTLRRRAQRQ